MLIKCKSVVSRVFLDVLIITGLFLFNAYFKDLWFPTTQRGFFCNDDSLKYPYRESTVTHYWLYVIAFYAPLALLVIWESFKCYNAASKMCLIAADDDERAQTWWNLLRYANFDALYNTLRYFLFGFAAERLLKQIGKHTIGRLRPHFFAVCQPLLGYGRTCDTADQMLTFGIYYTTYKCRSMEKPNMNITASMLENVHLSFPSGHSSLVFYGMIFIVLYLQQQQRQRCNKNSSSSSTIAAATLLYPLLQLLCVALAWFVALSRVLDYKHHWSDVVAGALLGTAVAIVVTHFAYYRNSVAAIANEQQQQHRNNAHGRDHVIEDLDEDIVYSTNAATRDPTMLANYYTNATFVADTGCSNRNGCGIANTNGTSVTGGGGGGGVGGQRQVAQREFCVITSCF